MDDEDVDANRPARAGSWVVNGTLYAVGGYNGSCLKTVEAYSPSSNTRLGKTPMGSARFALGAGVVNGTSMLWAASTA